MTVRVHDSRRWMALFPALLAFVLLLPACGQESRGPVVLKMQGSSLTLDDLRIEYDMRNKPGDFERATPEEREQFLRTIADKEILVREARAALGDLTPDEVQRVKEGREGRLLRSLETAVAASTDADTAGGEQLVREKFQIETRLLHFAGATDSITYWAHDEVAKGRSLSDLVRVHGIDPLMREKGGQLNWMNAIQLGYELAEELILEPKPAGYVTDVHRSMRGWEFFQVQEYRPVDITTLPNAPRMMLKTVQRIRHQMVVRAFLDSIETANGVEIMDEAGAVLHQAMSAYWDSLSAEVKRTGERPKEFHPPRWRVPAESQSMTLVRVSGKDVSIRAFMDDLSKVGPRIWPNAVKYDHFRKQIEARILIDLQLAEARRRGLDRTPEHLAAARQDEEKILLDRYYEQVITPQVEITDELVRKEYEETKDEFYTQQEKMRLSYMIFPKESEAWSFVREGRKHDYLWWDGELKRHEETRPDVTVVSSSPDYDLAGEVPADVMPIVKAAWDSDVADIVDPVKVAKGWAAVRVTYREHAGYIPLEKAQQSVKARILNRTVDEKVNAVLLKGRDSYRQKLFPEKLVPTG